MSIADLIGKELGNTLKSDPVVNVTYNLQIQKIQSLSAAFSFSVESNLRLRSLLLCLCQLRFLTHCQFLTPCPFLRPLFGAVFEGDLFLHNSLPIVGEYRSFLTVHIDPPRFSHHSNLHVVSLWIIESNLPILPHLLHFAVMLLHLLVGFERVIRISGRVETQNLPLVSVDVHRFDDIHFVLQVAVIPVLAIVSCIMHHVLALHIPFCPLPHADGHRPILVLLDILCNTNSIPDTFQSVNVLDTMSLRLSPQ